jgi:hypothetical protein
VANAPAVAMLNWGADWTRDMITDILFGESMRPLQRKNYPTMDRLFLKPPTLLLMAAIVCFACAVPLVCSREIFLW